MGRHYFETIRGVAGLEQGKGEFSGGLSTLRSRIATEDGPTRRYEGVAGLEEWNGESVSDRPNDVYMKKALLLIVAAGILAVTSGCNVHTSHFSIGWSNGELKAGTNIVQTAAIPASLKGLEVDNRYGSVQITGTSNGAAAWTWKLEVRARNDALVQQIAGSASCKAELDGDRLRLVVSLPDVKEPHSIQSDLVITVPRTAVVEARNHFGGTEIADLAGDVEASDEYGRVEIRNVVGRVRAKTSFASMSVKDTGPATLKNQYGETRAERIGGTLEAVTSFASLFADDIHGAASLEDQYGKIEATGIAAPLEAKTSFAPLVARDINGAVRLRDQYGSVNVVHAAGDAEVETSFASLSVEGIQGNAVLANQNGGVNVSGVSGSVKATTSFAAMDIAGAGPKFVCRNQNGAIRLRATSTTVTNIEARTSFAALRLQLPSGLKPAIQARTSFADVESDFPVLMKAQAEDPFADAAPDVPRITLQNQNGKISIVRD